MKHVAHLTAHSFIGIGLHTAVLIPLSPPGPLPLPHISMDTLLGLTIKAKWSKTVIGPFGFQLIGQGNDSGMVVPHICIPPNSMLVPLVIAFGSSKPMFSASTVKIDVDGSGLPIACNVIPYDFVGINQACNTPCNFPSDIVICPNTVVVGLTLGDFLAGLFLTVLDVGLSYASAKLGEKIGKKIVGAILGQLWKPWAQALASQFGGDAKVFLADAVDNALDHPISKVVSELIGDLASVVFDLTIGDPLSSRAGKAIHNAADGSAAQNNSPAANPVSSAGNTLNGVDGSDPRVYNAN